MARVARDEAIARIAAAEVAELPPDARREQVTTLAYACGLDNELPGMTAAMRAALLATPLDPQDPVHDAALTAWRGVDYEPATNAYLLERLRALDPQVDGVDGQPARREACPCCGRATLDARNACDICPVCWWEDGGEDSGPDALAASAENGGISLAQARVNALVHGIHDPARQDLRPFQYPARMYPLARVFRLSEDLTTLLEQDSDWHTTRFEWPETPR